MAKVAQVRALIPTGKALLQWQVDTSSKIDLAQVTQ